MYRLTWTINAAIGKNSGLIHRTISPVEFVTTITIQHCTRLVGIGIGKYRIWTLLDTQMRIGNGVTCRSIHHLITCFAIGLSLGNNEYVGNMIQCTDYLGTRIALKLHQVHAYGQTFQRHTILEQLVLRTCCKMFCFCQHRHT